MTTWESCGPVQGRTTSINRHAYVCIMYILCRVSIMWKYIYKDTSIYACICKYIYVCVWVCICKAISMPWHWMLLNRAKHSHCVRNTPHPPLVTSLLPSHTPCLCECDRVWVRQCVQSMLILSVRVSVSVCVCVCECRSARSRSRKSAHQTNKQTTKPTTIQIHSLRVGSIVNDNGCDCRLWAIIVSFVTHSARAWGRVKERAARKKLQRE